MSQQFSPEVMRKREALERVRRRVASIVVVAVAEHGILALIWVAGIIVDEPGRRGDAIGLLVMSLIVSILTYVAVRIILRGSLISWWVLVALAPPIIGGYVVLG